MTEDALWLIDLFNMQNDSLQTEMLDRGIRRDRFDRFSYGSWAIQETIKAIYDYDGHVSVNTIREILREQLTDYERYYSRNPERHVRYKYALNTIEHLYKLTGGYVNE